MHHYYYNVFCLALSNKILPKVHVYYTLKISAAKNHTTLLSIHLSSSYSPAHHAINKEHTGCATRVLATYSLPIKIPSSFSNWLMPVLSPLFLSLEKLLKHLLNHSIFVHKVTLLSSINKHCLARLPIHEP